MISTAPVALGGPVAWPTLSGAQAGCAKTADTLGTLATAPGGLYIQRQLQLADLILSFQQQTTLYCFNWQLPTTEAADKANPKDAADFSECCA